MHRYTFFGCPYQKGTERRFKGSIAVIKPNYSIRFKIIILLTAFISFHSIGKECLEELNFYKINKDNEIMEYEKAYGQLKPVLSESRMVGFMTDKWLDGKTIYLTQYALSPTLVVNNTDPQFVIANLENPLKIAKFAEKHHFTIVHKANKNIFLLKRQ